MRAGEFARKQSTVGEEKGTDGWGPGGSVRWWEREWAGAGARGLGPRREEGRRAGGPAESVGPRGGKGEGERGRMGRRPPPLSYFLFMFSTFLPN